MFSSPTPAPRSLASNTLRKAGLMDGDATMRDVSGGKQGGRKTKLKSHRTRPIDAALGGSSRTSTLASRIAASASSSSGALAIRGADRRTTVDLNRRRKAIGAPALISTRTPSVSKWKEVVEGCYDKEHQLLNLSNMIENELIKKHDLTPPGHGGTAVEASVIFKLAQKLQPPVTKLDLGDNGILADHLSRLTHYLGGSLQALSLRNNQIKTWKDVDTIIGKSHKDKFSRLQELMLSGNPLQVSQYEVGREDYYKSEIVRRFPTVTLLDGEPMARIAFDEPSSSISSANVSRPNATTFPVEMGPSTITGASPELVTNFLLRFLGEFDKNRAALVDVYHESSTFSYSANTTIPERARIQGFQVKLPNQKKLEWGVWLDQPGGGSRNLSRYRQWANKHDSRLKFGGAQAVQAMLQFPATIHDIGGPAENFCVDAMVVPHGNDPALLVTIHGQYVELPHEGLRSFDRTFILLPAAAGSRAQMAGWDVVILSDHLTIRNYSSPEAWRPGPMLVQAQLPTKKRADEQMQAIPTSATAIQVAPTPAPTLPPMMYTIAPRYQAAIMELPEMQRAMTVEICRMTNLIPGFGADCLVRNGGNMQMALANFEAVKATLGPDAFMQP